MTLNILSENVLIQCSIDNTYAMFTTMFGRERDVITRTLQQMITG